jgi:hypothetical protein
MANAPDTFFVTGLTNEQSLPSQILVTPFDGVQTTLDKALSSSNVISALQALPNSDAGLNSGDLFWNGGFLCKKA